jgi:uncharacterized protein (DUF4415 family)
MDDRKRTKAEERRRAELIAELEDMEAWFKAFQLKQRVMPRAWYAIHEATPCTPKKARLTAAFDEDLVRWYRSLGRGYQARMNAVLRAYMLACLSKEIERLGDRTLGGKPN